MTVNNWTPESMLEITLDDPDKFLIVMETLTRIGIAARGSNKLYQSCHILHKQGRYFLVHFKELFLLDGKPSTMDETDIKRRNTIGVLLQDWGLVDLATVPPVEERVDLSTIKIVKHKEKRDWELVSKYQIGNSKS